MGCTVIEMATGRPPWSECNNALTTMFYIANSNEPPKIPENFSPELRDFLQKCLKIIPCERANCLQLINHVFISGNQATYKEIVSPILRRNLVEKEQDFFEIKLSERPNRFNETFSKRNSGEHENDIKDSGLIFKIFKRKKSATKDHYNISGIISKDHINAFENNNLRNNNENLGSKGVEKEKIIDTSIENNNERKNPLKQQTSFDFFGIKKEYMLNEKVFSSEINEKSNSEIKTKTELGKISSIENLEKSDVSKQANKKIYGFEAKLEKENNDLRF